MPTIEIVGFKPEWSDEFREIARGIRGVLGEAAVRIDHIGSTAVPGLPAKDIIDIQVTVASLDDAAFSIGLRSMGAQPTNVDKDHTPPGMDLPPDELHKALFTLRSPLRPANIHVREEGRFNQQYALLCRDYLRTHSEALSAYAEIKHQLAARFPDDVDAYYAVKDPVFDLVMAGAREWAATTNWTAGPSSA